ncbi:hypothetical protein [Georgenia sp. SUBG003]|uniref:hypothetical protein n=1 Tax=Georgenia sp. SUBG003 TaxID=1497974 RepID=UPI003AB445F6
MLSRRRTGTVVAPTAAPSGAAVGIRAQAREFVERARAAGLGEAEVLDLVRGALMAGD